MEQDQELDSLSFKVIKESLEEHDVTADVLLHSLKIHCEIYERTGNDYIFKLSAAKICRTYGHFILKKRDSQSLNSFFHEWTQIVPEFMNLKIEFLKVFEI